jgi:hypothetical protein
VDGDETKRVAIVFDYPIDGVIKTLPNRGDIVELEIEFRSLKRAAAFHDRLGKLIHEAAVRETPVPIKPSWPGVIECAPMEHTGSSPIESSVIEPPSPSFNDADRDDMTFTVTNDNVEPADSPPPNATNDELVQWIKEGRAARADEPPNETWRNRPPLF